MSDLKIELVANVLYLNNRQIDLDAPVLQAVQFNDLVAVRLDHPGTQTETKDQNILLLNSEGKVIWRVEEFKFGDRSAYFTNIWSNESGDLCAFSRVGVQFVVDIKTGKLSNAEFIK